MRALFQVAGQFVAAKPGHSVFAGAVNQPEAEVGFNHLADFPAVHANPVQGAQGGGHGAGRHRRQQGAGADQPQRVNVQSRADGGAFRQRRSAFGFQDRAQVGRRRHFAQGGDQAAFGDVVEAVDVVNSVAEGAGGIDDADAGGVQVGGGAGDDGGVNAGGAQLGGAFGGQNGRSFNGDAGGQDDAVAIPGAAGIDDPAGPRRFAQHCAGDDRLRYRSRHLGMAANDGDVQIPAGAGQIGEQAPGVIGRKGDRQQRRRQKPAGDAAAGGNVIGVDLDGVPAGARRSQGNRVGGGDDEAAVHINDGAILAGGGAEQNAGVGGAGVGEEFGKQFGGQFANFQRGRASLTGMT